MRIPGLRPFLGLTIGLFLSSALHAEPLKAITWNLEWFPGGHPYAKRAERTKQIKGVTDVFKKITPDIFLAQEISYGKAFEDLVATQPGLKVDVISKFLDFDGKSPGKQQCAIASNLRAHSAWYESFKPSKRLPNLRRGFVFAALEHPDGGLIMVYSVHLKSNRGSETPEGEKDVADTRAESARQIIAHKAAMEKKFAGEKIIGWLIGGDFNTNHDGQFPMCPAVADLVKTGFHNSWDDTPKEARLTWRPSAGDNRFKPTTFDYILTTGFKETQAKMIQGVPVEVSDHAPVEILLEKN